MTGKDVGVANINIGILGHVDSGKTSLARALSSIASTAAFDKSPESQRRGITLDLGFSACRVSTAVAAPPLRAVGIEEVQCTFVDCPGHASLIRTILGGAQIIDIMILVIDACKGIQTQTAECLVIGEVLCKPLVVVINKIDAVQGRDVEERCATIEKLRNRLRKTFEHTRWPSVPMVEVAAAPRGDAGEEAPMPVNVNEVISAVLALVDAAKLKRQLEEPLLSEEFVMMVDHCFALKGQGSVFTGTVLRGQVSVGDSILIPESHMTRKVKGLQVFRKPVQRARRGDRVGLCVTQFDAEAMERGLLCSVQTQRGAVSSDAASVFEGTSVMIAEVNRVRFHHLPCDAHTKFHVTIGHSTVMGTMRYFSRLTAKTKRDEKRREEEKDDGDMKYDVFDLKQESQYIEELGDDSCLVFDQAMTGSQKQLGHPVAVRRGVRTYYAIILLDRPILAAVGTPLIATRLDVERENMCRIAIAGVVRALLRDDATGSSTPPLWRSLPIVRFKTRRLVVERVVNEKTCIASGVVSAEVPYTNVNGDNKKNKNNNTHNSDHTQKKTTTKDKDALHAEVQKFIGLRVCFRPTSGQQQEEDEEREQAVAAAAADDDDDDDDVSGMKEGVIDSAFGKTGKVKLVFKDPVFLVEDKPAVAGRAKRNEVTYLEDGVIELKLKKFPLAVYSQLQQ